MRESKRCFEMNPYNVDWVKLEKNSSLVIHTKSMYHHGALLRAEGIPGVCHRE